MFGNILAQLEKFILDVQDDKPKAVPFLAITFVGGSEATDCGVVSICSDGLTVVRPNGQRLFVPITAILHVSVKFA
jgi:hypothetical protein